MSKVMYLTPKILLSCYLLIQVLTRKICGGTIIFVMNKTF